MSLPPGDRARSWRTVLGSLVDEAIHRQEASVELTVACAEQARRCDVGDDDAVITAFTELLRLAGHLWRIDEQELARQLLAVSMDIALDSYLTSRSPLLLVGHARQLAASGLVHAGLGLVDQALGLDVSPLAEVPDGIPAPVVMLENQRGRLLQELDEAEVAFRAALAALGASSRHDGVRAVVLNNLGLVRQEKGDLEEARDLLVRSLEISDRVGGEPIEIAITLDNLGLVESDLARLAGSLELSVGGDRYVNMVTSEHLNQAEQHFDQALGLFEAGLPGSAGDYVTSLINRADVARLRGDPAALESVSRRALELAVEHPVPIVTRWEAVALRGRVLQDAGASQEAVGLLVPWFEELRPHMVLH